jgi:hypothetical protein
MFTATLHCGTMLSFEARSFRPDPGDLVPCRHHGYCVVRGTGGPATGGGSRPRVEPRAQSELRHWLRGRSETSVHALRRHGFTLRMVAAAERDGLVDVDLPAGRVAVRPGIGAESTASEREQGS